MRVVFIAAECEPWAKTGGLGDVVDALARALGRIAGAPTGPAGPDRPVDVFLPRYRSVPLPDEAVSARRPLRLPNGGPAGEDIEVTILDVAADGYRLRLVDHPAAFDRDGFYGDSAGDYADNAWRFSLFCRAALETIRAEGGGVDVLHVHDWHTGPALLQRDGLFGGDPSIAGLAVLLSIHNLAYHGWVPPAAIGQLGTLAPPLSRRAGLDLLEVAIERSDLVNTVSPGFAAEALQPDYGMGLDRTLRAKGDRFFGILNGIDPIVWNPATDGDLAATYDGANRRGKTACRRAMLTEVGFDADDDGAVFGMIGRLDPQKGFDLLAGAAERIVESGGRLIVQGSGDPALAAPFRRLAAVRPRQIALLERFDRRLARRIYAGVDLFVMPSRFEPCGQGQMIALRYGTPPIVRRTGGLADSVIDLEERPASGTGFVFDEATPEALLAACRRAMAVRSGEPRTWEQLLERGMAVDFGWEHGPAQHYLAAYGRAMSIRAAHARG